MEKLIIPSLLTVPDVVSMTDTILKTTLPATDTDSRFKSIYSRNKSIFDRLVKNQNNSSKSGLTEKLIFSDRKRDLGFLSFRYIIFGMASSVLPQTAAKASVVYAIIEKHGKNIHRLSYKTESAVLLSLFNELDKEENLQLIIDLGLLPYYDSLKASEADFNLVSTQKTDEKTIQNNDSEAASMVVNEMMPALTGLVAMLQLYSELEPTVYGDMYNKVVTCISETNALARARKTRKLNKNEEEMPAQV